jgi:transposase-like protein
MSYLVGMVTITLHCPNCGGTNVVRNGHASNGKQRFLCRGCRKSFREDPESPSYSPEERRQILATYEERASLRGLTRIFGVSRNTVSKWIREDAEALPPSGADARRGRARGGAGTR